LVIEVDGGQHFNPLHAEADRERSEWLESRGLRVLRFTNREVLNEMESLLERILVEIGGNEGPQPSP
jgi:very-short-patch-repair endonuclease